jgi:hypothetical protein
MYYSTGILSQALPEAASYVSLGVTVINVIMTFPPVFFVEVCGIVMFLSCNAYANFSVLANAEYYSGPHVAALFPFCF